MPKNTSHLPKTSKSSSQHDPLEDLSQQSNPVDHLHHVDLVHHIEPSSQTSTSSAQRVPTPTASNFLYQAEPLPHIQHVGSHSQQSSSHKPSFNEEQIRQKISHEAELLYKNRKAKTGREQSTKEEMEQDWKTAERAVLTDVLADLIPPHASRKSGDFISSGLSNEQLWERVRCEASGETASPSTRNAVGAGVGGH
ncbi:uncharacterized protein MONOS_9360 [Monocercomonoides exilis]|uniref:uncharacterized protein n=1 Tax=Monocercomonoides exilis TaxID=2049356 RepID=UPI00355A75EF|nr:hypothetical protein MONOS_9360 [Monocercomonoides exilis]|eukprot:MONOS_9360.1-p1 / transcript=MONOS_9360.1 / gene=MONOS_9360 / organism=Monocercomonoides_exilis_PA203 / gene_product=unspecified product / transcript_product=unspecified product / location=Mono_scaffold00384:8152-8739(-) / protein_length=196 / sequence_SO=supercontig / SO=protein_coding / is_pseudo=false